MPAPSYVPVRRASVEVLFTLQKETARPNGLQYDAASDRLLAADQRDGALITVEDPRGQRRQSEFAACSTGPSGVTVMPWQGERITVMSGTHAPDLTVIEDDGQVYSVDHRGVGTGIVGFSKEPVTGQHTGFHGLEWDGSHLWAASPPARKIFRLDLQPDAAGRPSIAGCSWFPLVFGNRPHGLAWADPARRTVWCNDTTLNCVYRYDTVTGECVEILVLPADAPLSHGMTIVDGDLWYCEDNTARICRVVSESA